jgi:C4-dicarboxylate-specific signal transduction histidine kinase
VIHKDGSTRWFLTRGEVVERLEGGRARMMGTYTDVTERRLAEEALAQAEARLSFLARTSTLAEVTASIAHELNQPLCAIVANAGACARLLDSAASHDEIRSALKDVIDDSLRASDVLTRTRMLFTQHDVQAAPLDLAEAVHDVLKLAQPQLRQAGVEVEVEARPGTPLMALADALHVRQVLLNLVLNGVDSMREVDGRRRRLDIQLRRGRHMAYVTVRDRGKGLDPATRPQIFEPFFTTKPQGLGMGLTISRTIVDSYGGSIWAVANADGGATFRFSLPVAEAASTV